MALITFHNGTPGNPLMPFDLIERLLLNGTPTQAGPGGFVTTEGSLTLRVLGHGLTYGGSPLVPPVIGGTVQDFHVLQGGQLVLTMSAMALSGLQLGSAILSERSGQVGALEGVLGSQPWGYDGTSADEVLSFKAFSADGARITLPNHDIFDLRAGNDSVYLWAGNDVAYGGDGDDTLEGGSGRDRLDGDADEDRLFGGADRDTLIGDAGADRLNGGCKGDRLEGGSGADTLRGEGGADTLVGGRGGDLMIGGPGADVFIIAARSDFGLRDNADQINGFASGLDRLDLTGLQATFDGTDFAGTARSLRFVQREGRAQLQLDEDGDLQPDAILYLDGTVGLAAADLIL